MSASQPAIPHLCLFDERTDGERLDAALHRMMPEHSRNLFSRLIKEGHVLLNGSRAKPSSSVKAGDCAEITFSFPPLPEHKPIPEGCVIPIIAEYEHFLIINKPPHLMVHVPSPRSGAFTVVDWLLAHFKEIKNVGASDRPGIVHRLDKDTSGIMVVPRTPYAHARFGELFRTRAIKKTYLAIAEGHTPRSGSIEYGIDRHPSLGKMIHTYAGGRASLTNYQVREYFDQHSLLEVAPVTGRTHQIRVHCAAIGHPLLGDELYGRKSKIMRRQALHAHSLRFVFDGEEYSFSAEPPADFIEAISQLRLMKEKRETP